MDIIKLTLESARINAHLTQKQVAEILNTSPQTVCAWEKEPWKVNIKTAYALADLYKVRIDNLIFLD